jgi:2-polyprenyl-3-methyl-5-hydroxy-6-metoxy-1,4-benzoquinol methylase
MGQESLSARQRRERDFYDQFVKIDGDSTVVEFAPVEGDERRPWNSYWYFYGRVRELASARNLQILDFGCGRGTASILYARLGYLVRGFDIAPGNVDLARRLSARYGVADRVSLDVGTAERLEYPDASFDVVAGIDVLHHVDIPTALAECRRVLKPGGVALFHEPVAAPVFDTLRNTRFGRWLVPNEASLERHVTHDERKLDAVDLRNVYTAFPEVVEQRFRLLSRVSRLPGLGGGDAFQRLTRLEQVDRRVLERAPWLKPFAGMVVLELRKPAENPAAVAQPLPLSA